MADIAHITISFPTQEIKSVTVGYVGGKGNQGDSTYTSYVATTADDPVLSEGDWSASNIPPVDSVAGKTGDVVLVKDDVGLPSVDNTSDADKPVSTLQQAALDDKHPTIDQDLNTGDSPTFAGLNTTGDVEVRSGNPSTSLRVGYDITENGVLMTWRNDLGKAFIQTTGSLDWALHLGAGDNSHLVIDTDGNVGINTSTPDERLHVVGNAKLEGDVEVTGSLGLGTATPEAVLSVGSGTPTGTQGGSPNPWGLYVASDRDASFNGYTTFNGSTYINGPSLSTPLGYFVKGNNDHVLALEWNSISITALANRWRNHDHGAQTDPTLFVHSATDPDTDNTEFVSLTHNKTNGVFNVGKGHYLFNNGDIEITDTTKGIILTSPDASRWRVTIDNSGNLITTSI